MGKGNFEVPIEIVRDDYTLKIAHGKAEAMRHAYGLTVTCWTELDEGLSQLSSAVRSLEKGDIAQAATGIRGAMEYMNRWQDRGGAIGNCDCLTETELAGFTLEDGRSLPASLASARIEELSEVCRGLRVKRSVFGESATLTINPSILNRAELRAAWPMLLDRLVPAQPH